jgi:hypothetical protein
VQCVTGSLWQKLPEGILPRTSIHRTCIDDVTGEKESTACTISTLQLFSIVSQPARLLQQHDNQQLMQCLPSWATPCNPRRCLTGIFSPACSVQSALCVVKPRSCHRICCRSICATLQQGARAAYLGNKTSTRCWQAVAEHFRCIGYCCRC